MISNINFKKKPTGKRSEGKLHAAFDEAGTGNGSYDTAPDFDPTCESLWGRFPWATLHVATFQYYRDAKQFMQEMKTRLQKFNLELAPNKTRLLGDRNNRGQK